MFESKFDDVCLLNPFFLLGGGIRVETIKPPIRFRFFLPSKSQKLICTMFSGQGMDRPKSLVQPNGGGVTGSPGQGAAVCFPHKMHLKLEQKLRNHFLGEGVLNKKYVLYTQRLVSPSPRVFCLLISNHFGKKHAYSARNIASKVIKSNDNFGGSKLNMRCPCMMLGRTFCIRGV